jgi:hypothetical protein
MYHVALLIERELVGLDADQVIALHEGLEEPVQYDIVMPVPDAPVPFSTSVATLGDVAPLAAPAVVQELREQAVASAQAELEASARLLHERGQKVSTTLAETDPVVALKDLVTSAGASEAIILTEPHFVREFLHVDWTSRARRRLNVPTLHLIEHVPFAAQQ